MVLNGCVNLNKLICWVIDRESALKLELKVLMSKKTKEDMFANIPKRREEIIVDIRKTNINFASLFILKFVIAFVQISFFLGSKINISLILIKSK